MASNIIGVVDLCKLTSQCFYKSMLKTADHLKVKTTPFPLDVFIDSNTIPFTSSTSNRTSSGSAKLNNPREASVILGLFERGLFDVFKDKTIMILTPYNDQVNLIQELLSLYFGGEIPKNVSVLTIDTAQGKEGHCVIISLVRYYQRTLGIIDSHRANVALSRQKECRIVVGSLEYWINWSSNSAFGVHARDTPPPTTNVFKMFSDLKSNYTTK